MKKITSIAAFLLFGFAINTHAETIAKVENSVEKPGKKVGHKTAEVASKGQAKVTDEVYKDKTGPNGEIVYIDNHSKYYWVDTKGHRHYAEESTLIPKKED